ncbi:MAG: hypothetical protein GTO40_19440 [Deltaproteobacteria bacterium]|nr:hypothetical protein [Deltaproteobacteria bacterium]
MKQIGLCIERQTLFVAAFFSFFLFSPNWSAAQKSKPSPPKNWEETVRMAEEEGKVSIYMSRGGEFHKVVAAFHKAYPKIRVTQVLGGFHYASRILSERRANKFLADMVVTGPGTPYYVLYKGRFTDPIKPKLMLAEVTDTSKWWAGKHHYIDPEESHVFVFMGPVSAAYVAYNTKAIDGRDFKSYYDLLNPKWRGKILMEDPRAPGAARLGLRILFNLPELGPKYIRRLFGEMNLTLTRDRRQSVDWLAVGKYPLCMFCSDARYAEAQGLPVAEFRTVDWLKRPAVAPGGTSTLTLLNRAPHPNASTVFINWMLSRIGQTALQDALNVTSRVYESMREDIPKDRIPAEFRRKKGVDYVMMATPTRSDNGPPAKLLRQILK